jgi:hypothetical protein
LWESFNLFIVLMHLLLIESSLSTAWFIRLCKYSVMTLSLVLVVSNTVTALTVIVSIGKETN